MYEFILIQTKKSIAIDYNDADRKMNLLDFNLKLTYLNIYISALKIC